MHGEAGIAMLAQFADVCYASLPPDALAALADVRAVPGVMVLRQAERVWVRWEAGDERILVALNMAPEPGAVDLPAGTAQARLLLSSFCDRAGERVGALLQLRGNEGVIVEL